MQDPSNPAPSQALSGLLKRLPTGLPGAVFWLAIWFCALFLGRRIPGAIGTFLAFMQIVVGIALVCVAVPLLWRLVRKYMLWSLRNKLVLTYLLIGLAPVVLFVTLVSVMAYIAAGQFAIHLASSRLISELNQMSGENGHRADQIQSVLDRGTGAVDIRQDTETEAQRASAMDVPRLKLHRETQAFLNGASIPLGIASRGKTPFGLPPWATDLSDGHFSGMVLDGGDLYLVSVHQRKLHDGRIFTLVSSLPVDGSVLNLIAEGLGHASLLPERAGAATNANQTRTSSPEAALEVARRRHLLKPVSRRLQARRSPAQCSPAQGNPMPRLRS